MGHWIQGTVIRSPGRIIFTYSQKKRKEKTGRKLPSSRLIVLRRKSSGHFNNKQRIACVFFSTTGIAPLLFFPISPFPTRTDCPDWFTRPLFKSRAGVLFKKKGRIRIHNRALRLEGKENISIWPTNRWKVVKVTPGMTLAGARQQTHSTDENYPYNILIQRSV